MGIPKFLATFFIGNSQKNIHFFGRMGKEDVGIPKNCDRFWYKIWEFPILLPFLKQKVGNSQFFGQFFRIPIFKDKNSSLGIPKF